MDRVEPQRETIVVTGAAGGIGAATCRHLAGVGRHVVVLDRRLEPAEDLAEEIGGLAVGADVSDPDAIREAFAVIARTAGPVRGLVNNAGIGGLKALEDYAPDEVERIWRVNVTGTYNCLRAAAASLHAASGAVVNVASVSGLRPTRGEAPYSAAKAAVIALTRSAALEWAPRVRVNCVSPGFIRTPLNEVLAGDDDLREGIEKRTPAGRIGTPEEVAATIAFLLSEDAGYCTGQNVVLDGGSTLSNAQMDPVFDTLLGY